MKHSLGFEMHFSHLRIVVSLLLGFFAKESLIKGFKDRHQLNSIPI